jgi:hypothetical protein
MASVSRTLDDAVHHAGGIAVLQPAAPCRSARGVCWTYQYRDV